MLDDDHEDIELKKMADEYVKKGGKIKDRKENEKLTEETNKTNKKSSLTQNESKILSDYNNKGKTKIDSDDSGVSDDSDSESESSSDSDTSDSDYDTSELYRKEKESRKKEKALAKKDGFETVPVNSGI